MDSTNHEFSLRGMKSFEQSTFDYQTSRLSPARSISSFDQFTHCHGKGDSAYSSFSGCSNAPDCYSCPEEIYTHNLQYADLKYVRAVYNPKLSVSDPRSMESFSQTGKDSPPTPPTRHQSFVTTRVLEKPRFSFNVDEQERTEISGSVGPHLVPRTDQSYTGSPPSYRYEDPVDVSEMHSQPQSAHVNASSSNIQNKCQYYYVTGVCMPSEMATEHVKPHHEEAPCSSERHRPALKPWSSQIEDTECDMRETDLARHKSHNSAHRIFYCGPEESSQALEHSRQSKEAVHIPSEPGPGNKIKKQPLGDVASEKINKETTPLLYHLTGEQRASFLYWTRNENEPGDQKTRRTRSASLKQQLSREAPAKETVSSVLKWSCADDIEEENMNQEETMYSSGSSVDESYKKYYREKIKLAQTKVLRETSFKRKDLQLSWPHRLKPKVIERPSVLHFEPPAFTGEAEAKTKKEPRKVHAAQTRLGMRKRLRPEQKKMYHSEPEKLNRLEESRQGSLGSEEEDSNIDHRELGLVAIRKKMFERGRASSTSSLSKNELKQMQHSALVEYMERKTGHKPSEAHQHRPLTPGGHQDRGLKVVTRPFSAGRVLDLSPGSGKHTRSPSSASIEDQGQEQQLQAVSQSCVKSVSAEFLLDEKEQFDCIRARSNSSPFPVQTGRKLQSLPGALGNRNSSSRSNNQAIPIQLEVIGSAGEDAPQIIKPRGKSMEELGTVELLGRAVLSRSTEDLCELKKRSIPAGPLETLSLSAPIVKEQAKGSMQDVSKNSVGHTNTTSETELHIESQAPLHLQNVSQVAPTSLPTSSLLLSSLQSLGPLANVPEIFQSLEASGSKSADVSSEARLTPPEGEPELPFQDEEHADPGQTGPPIAEKTDKANSAEVQHDEPVTESSKEQTHENDKWEELVSAIVAADHSLADVLEPLSSRKTTLSLMEQLLSEDTLLMEEYYKRKQMQQQAMHNNGEMDHPGCMTFNPPEKPQSLAGERTVLQSNLTSCDDSSELMAKKNELLRYIRCQMQLLEGRRLALAEDLTLNCSLGRSVEANLQEHCTAGEFERYTLFVGDLERVVSLLLCLSARLARVKNALSKVNSDTDAEEQQSLNERHKLLCRQRDDAKDLRDNLDRRERVILEILSKYLDEQQLQDFKRFVRVKASLLIEQKDIDERTRVLEEQLQCLEGQIPV
ncbi:protein Shroom1 [Erpetoichthys calabaricus]|uniref:Shroom family member 1 n=1 Tax=Erpetoichthys calabaricus TaxID=27687 RepID=A0A8C4S4X3_ERPCA|nr:protein Shroom1 [Erpetoichthys calabaricus]XP_028668584.1 protein Shroom1 [Erpetoichthys calabaricus]XP_051789934.1 protein Shroom1 [Erpetoichthys calabaricus]